MRVLLDRLGRPYIAGGNVKWGSHFGKTTWQFFKWFNIEVAGDPALLLLDTYPRARVTFVCTKACTQEMKQECS